MIDMIKKSLSTPEGWVAGVAFISNAIQYFTPETIDQQIQNISYAVCTIIVGAASLFHMVKAGKKEDAPAA